MKEKSVVGDLINFRGLVYAPVNENGVILLFGKIAADLNMYVEEIRPAFPDCVARRFTGKGWEKILIEFEFRASHFQDHNHDPKGCDVIVCWENDWAECPIEVLELKEIIKDLPNMLIERPDVDIGKKDYSLEKHYHTYGEKIKSLFEKFDPQVKKINEEIFPKLMWRGVTYYSPERVFCYCDFQKSSLRLTVFTRGKELKGTTKFEYHKGGQKWGRFNIKEEGDISTDVGILKESHKRIKEALKANENTGWYAEIEED